MKLISINAGANRASNAISVSNNLVAFAFGDSISINLKILFHGSKVTCLSFLNNSNLLISGATDGSVKLWSLTSDSCTVITGHTASITCIGVMHGDLNSNLIATSSSDGTIRIHSIGIDSIITTTCIQVINVKNFSLAMSLATLPNSSIPVLFTAGTDTLVHVYIQEDGLFKLHLSLPGHADWIRSLSIKTISSKTSDKNFSTNDLVLASSSQDKYIRLWKVSDKLSIISNDSTHSIKINDKQFTFSFDSLLIGHDDWVHSVFWDQDDSKMRLVSASADKSLMIWNSDIDSNLWIPTSVGIGGTLGFYNGILFNDTIIGQGYNGSLTKWKLIDDNWELDIGTSGHFKPIKDLSWDESGKYILTASLDETTRIFSRFINSPTFCEISRPQIHGYPINSLSFTSRHQYISASDEKVLRIFEAPISFIETLTKCGINDDDKIRLQAATLPILGLSNKSTSNPQFNSSNKIVEGLLNQKTLWPESMKLYGHNYELVAVDSRNGIVASSNRASNRKSAGIRIWDLDTNLEVFSFYPHNLTVTKLKFSICGKFLASASRDRTFKVSGFVDGKWDVLFSDSFTRVVWDCSWSNDGLFVCACSRDKTLVVYKTGKWERILSVSFESGVNCCDFYIKDGRYFIAVGLELDIIVLEIDVGNCHYKEISKWTGIKGVNVVKWNKDGLFAVGGDDCAMRVYSVFEGGPDL